MAQQVTLFESDSSTMAISEVADGLRVSEASVRNWIKAGYLDYDAVSGVSRGSFDCFRQDIAGKSKLTKRANKSLVDKHDHEYLVAKILRDPELTSGFSNLSNDYQNGMSNSYRNREGIYYTPENICEMMLSDIPGSVDGKLFCDPCCGSGNFIMAALGRGFSPENIYGYDIDSTAVEITRQRIFQETGFDFGNIVCADFLKISTTDKTPAPRFDVIMTNPPWGKKIRKSEKEAYGKILNAGRSLDTSSLFFIAAMKNLKDNGFLSFLMPESFFKIAVFQDARRYLFDFSLLNIRDFGNAFKGILTKAQSFCLHKTAPNEHNEVNCIGKYSFLRRQKTFQSNPAVIINFETGPEDALVIARLFEKPHITLKNQARWGLGIVTGNNKKFCTMKPGDGLMPVYRGMDIHKGFIDEPKTFIPSDLSLYQQVAPIDLFEAESKIIYRFISSKPVFFHDRKKSYFLNSVNMIIPFPDFPISTDNIVKLLDSELFGWFFAKLFNTHKILRTDLEKLPLPLYFSGEDREFTENELIEFYGLERTDCGNFRIN